MKVTSVNSSCIRLSREDSANTPIFWAHSSSDGSPPPLGWHSLVDHLLGVRGLAATFCRAFEAGEYGAYAGYLHDLGKFEPAFQSRILKEPDAPERVPHAHHGAAVAWAERQPAVSFAINGHHAGLHDKANLLEKVDKKKEFLERGKDFISRYVPTDPSPAAPSIPFPEWIQGDAFAADLFVRFLFSALIDADRLDTERFCRPDATDQRAGEGLNPQQRLERLLSNLAGRDASKGINSIRREILDYCVAAGKLEPGLFSLTAPTGAGKTLASMAFALAHAAQYGHRRVIVVIPYLSIIEQNARVYREIFGDEVVLEHHSQAAWRTDPEKNSATVRQKLASENWDMPVVVTTSAQFFDSLFSRYPGDARKLHNIARSVVIFDEVQTFPPHLLPPILNVLKELASSQRRYGCSFLFTTATQPAFTKRAGFEIGLENIREVVPSEASRRHFQALKRVSYQWPAEGEAVSWETLAERVLSLPRALVIVNQRAHARSLWQLIKEKTGNATFHLSTWMVPQHRLRVLEAVRDRLLNSTQPCYLISTQCVEAGVDISFPAIFRAMGPYDAVVQAAGRCNREMELGPGGGQVVIFRPAEGQNLRGIYTTAIRETENLLAEGDISPDDPSGFDRYFRRLYGSTVGVRSEIQEARRDFRFEAVSEQFRFIEDVSWPVVVPFGPSVRRILDEGRAKGFLTRDDWRRLQPFTVGLFKQQVLEQKLSRRVLPEDILHEWPASAYDDGPHGCGLLFQGTPAVELVV